MPPQQAVRNRLHTNRHRKIFPNQFLALFQHFRQSRKAILRLIVNDTAAACATLAAEGHLINTTDVVGVKIGDEPGKLSKALELLDAAGINMEYLYAFMTRTEKHAYVVLRVADNAAAESALEEAGFHLITDADVNKL